MQEAVSDVLVDRAREADGLTRMVAYSIAAHALLVAVIVLLPESWRQRTAPPDAIPMTITIGGAPGPANTGMTPIAGRAVQAVAPPDTKPAPQPAPAATPPEMTLPSPVAKPAPKTPPKPIEKPAEKSTTSKPTTGAEIKTGSAKVDTGGAPVPFGGLATGGGGGTGVRTDVGDFCCPAYITTMVDLIRKNWNRDQSAPGTVEVKFTILRDGKLTAIEVEKTSGSQLLDLASLRAVSRTERLPPLPREFTRPTLTVFVIFEYQR
jgi:periplasmic protein TonB